MQERLGAKDGIAASMVKAVEHGVRIRGRLVLESRGPDGAVTHRTVVENTVQAAGLAAIADQLIASPTLGKPTHMAIGTGSPASTLLGAEVARVAFTSKVRSGAVVTMVGDFAAGVGTGTITEAGIFDVVTANTVNMLCKASGFTHSKGAGDSLSFSWSLTLS